MTAPLADSALSARYAAALQAATQPPDIQERMASEMLEMFPPNLRESMDQALAPMGGLAGMLRQQQAAGQAEQERVALLSAQLALAPMDEEDIRATTAYYESQAGRYVSRQLALVMMEVQVPRMVEAMRPMFAMLEAQMGGLEIGDEDGPEVFDVAEVQPEIIGGFESLNRAIEFPEDARMEGVEGRVIIQFVVGTTGAVSDVTVGRSPDERLSQAAMAAVRGLRFTPGRVNDEPVRVRFSLPVTFRLTDTEASEDS